MEARKGENKKVSAARAELGRSQVGLGQNLGTRTFKSPKDYDRRRLKAELRKETSMM